MGRYKTPINDQIDSVQRGRETHAAADIIRIRGCSRV